MQMVNLTPHAITIVTVGGNVTIPPSGNVARVAATPTSAGEVSVGTTTIPLTRTAFGDVQDLPDAQPGVLLLVSGLVRSAVPNRNDVASPGDLVRDANGQPVGCKGLIVN